jgi:hypothetical protein
MATKILSDDIELRASERMTDASDGGGEMSAVVIDSNKINQVFGPISSADRDAGRINLRQLYPHITTTTADTLYGANVIIEQAPTDPTVEVALFNPGIYGAVRSQAQSYIESYTSIGPRSRMQPVGTQVIGQSQILTYQALNSPIPLVGDVFVLSVETGTTAGTQQAFKITGITSTTETFTYTPAGGGNAEYTCTQLVITISQPLVYNFPGTEPSPLRGGDTWVRRTTVSTAAKYYGTTGLQTAATVGDQQIIVDNIFKQLVPAVNTDTIVPNAQVGYSIANINAGSHTVAVSNPSHSDTILITPTSSGINYIRTLRPLPAPSTLSITYRTGGIWYLLQDNGTGNIAGDATEYGAGTINYTTGTCIFSLGYEPDIGSSIILQWGSPAHYEVATSINATLPTMVINLNESVDPVGFEVHYVVSTATVIATIVEGNGYNITGTGVTGLLEPNTGSVYLSFSIIPDVGSSIVIHYNHYTNISTTLHEIPWTGSTGELTFTLANAPIKPGSVSLSWKSDAKYGAAEIHMPAVYATTVPQNPLIWPSSNQTYATHAFLIIANESGLFNNAQGDPLGTVNHTTGLVTINPTPDIPAASYYNDQRFGEMGPAWASYPHAQLYFRGYFYVRYSLASVVPAARISEPFPLPAITFQFGGITNKTLVPGSLRFRWGSQEYRDLNGDGSIYRHVQPWSTQAGTLAGTIDYGTRVVALTNYERAATNNISTLSCLLRWGTYTTSKYYARAPASNIKTGSFALRATTTDGRLLIGECVSGNLITANAASNGTDIGGTLDQEMGIIAAKFGVQRTVASLSPAELLEPWYNVADIYTIGSVNYIWKPTLVLPDSIRIDCITVTTLPLAANELGLDPVRLPSTGKVPIFKPGNRICVHNTQYVTLSNPAVAGAIINCARTRIKRVYLMDAAGRRVPDDRIYNGQYVQYNTLTLEQQATFEFWQIQQDGTVWLQSSTNLDAGLVQLASPLDLTGYDQPLKLYHTIEDSALATNVDLSGLIKLNKPLTYNFNTNSYVSSQLFWGDMWARYTSLFSQTTWTSVWKDSLIGSTTAAQFNDVLYPIIVTNKGIIQERWRITFTSTTNFDVYGERIGKIATGDINTDCAPINPATNSAYFFIDLRGWGLGWIAGNTLRYNTVWPISFWAARCVNPGTATTAADSLTLALRADSEPA